MRGLGVWEESLSESARRAAVIERGEGGDRGWMRWMEVFTMGDARAREWAKTDGWVHFFHSRTR